MGIRRAFGGLKVVHVNACVICNAPKGARVKTPFDMVLAQVYSDNDTSTKFAWRRPFTFSPTSTATVHWTIPEDTPAGLYKLGHRGNNKKVLGGVGSFSGFSSAFYVRAAQQTWTSRVAELWHRLHRLYTWRCIV